MLCHVRVSHLGEAEVRADMVVLHEGGVWAKVWGWKDRRFNTDERLWPLLRQPEGHLVSRIREPGYSEFRDTYRSAPSRDYLSRRFLSGQERAEYLTVGPRRQRQWLAGRIAAKDAVRARLWSRGYGPIFPAEIVIGNEPGGRPVVHGPFREDLRVSIAHKDDVAVAMVAEGRDVGIDIEHVEVRGGDLETVVLTDDERKLIAPGNRNTEVARFFSAKEALAKARGEGLKGNPRRYVVTSVAGDRLIVDGVPVETRRDGDYIVSWTSL